MPPHGSADELITRALLGALVAGIVAATARRAGALSPSGQWAAFAIGTAVSAVGWWWAALLVAWFSASSLLTRVGRERKRALVDSVLPDDAARGGAQVLANGGLFTLLLLGGALTDDLRLSVAAAGALAAAAADTWATEVGLLWGGTPRMILTGDRLAPGRSGGVTVIGVAASVIAAALMAWGAQALLPAGRDPTESIFRAVFTGGLAGSVADSVLGATVQSKRWCDQCRAWTERRVHTCGFRTAHARGVRWMTNDVVNLLATVTGALVALSAVGPLD
jgi:uncharacterized protein (TIGR00297 family)